MDGAKYRLDLKDERLWIGDQPVQITNKAFRLLRLFVCNPNRLLTKDDILDAVWRDVCVSEGLIKEYVHDLRLALDDDPKNPRFIETVHGRGYRFLGGVEESSRSDGVAALNELKARPPSLAVRPFENLTGEEHWDRFCRGITDDLIIDIARYPELLVVASGLLTGSSQACEARTDYALAGTVQVSGFKIRVNAKLIEIGRGTHVWTDQYERELGELFAVQNDIVGQVASAIGGFSGQIPHTERLRLGRTLPIDLNAYELYLLSHELEANFKKESTLRAFELAQRALKLDPNYARAWLVRGWTCWQIVLENWTNRTQDYADLLRESFSRAAALDPLDPLAMMELAAVRAADDDITGAHDALERALDLGSNQADLLISSANPIVLNLDDPQRAKQTLDRGLDLLAMVGDWHRLSMARVAYFTRDFEQALNDARRGPDNLLSRLIEILSLAQLGPRKKVRELVGAFRVRHPNFNPQEFIKSYPITAAGARRLFLEGIEKAGLAELEGVQGSR